MSIRKRGDKYLVTVELGRDATGRRRRHCSTHDTEDDAKRAEAVARAKVATDEWVDETTMTVAAYLPRWLEQRRHSLEWATHDTYRQRIEGPIADRLGRHKLKKLQPLHIIDFETYLYGEGLSATTVRKYRVMLKQAFGAAVAMGLLAKNPADGLEPIREDTPEVRWLTASEQAALLETARVDALGKPSRMYLPVLLALGTGMRRGELLALRWADVDFAHERVTVRRGLQKGKDGPKYRRGGKGGKGRVVALPATLLPLLTAHREEQARLRAAAGEHWKDGDLIFCGATGEPWNLDGFHSSWRRARVRAKLPDDVHFHCLRHTYATELLLAGVHPKIVSEALGHSTVRMTLDRYSHAIPHLQTEAASLMDGRLRALLGGEAEG